MTENKPSVAPVPAATILLVRDAPNGMEVFMVKRHHQIDFVAGALVFPGRQGCSAETSTKGSPNSWLARSMVAGDARYWRRRRFAKRSRNPAS
jgi:hypothetical protein